MIELECADDAHETACDRPGQSAVLAVAIQLAAGGATQEVIVATLRARFPGLPNENYYQNPAAAAVMRRVRREQQRCVGLEADRARLRTKGLPEHLAEREPRRPWTDSDQDSDWRGPLHAEVVACNSVFDLVKLCERHDLYLSLDEQGLKLSRRIASDSELLAAIRRAKPQLVAMLEAQSRPIGEYE